MLHLLELIQLILEQGNNNVVLAALAHAVSLATKLLHICPDGLQLEAYLRCSSNMFSKLGLLA